MFDVGFPELLIVAVVLLLVVGPERMPEVLRTVGRWMGSARRSFDHLRRELEREVGADEIRRDLHNARIMEQARELRDSMASSRDEVEELLGKRYATLKDEGRILEELGPTPASQGSVAPESGADDPAGHSSARADDAGADASPAGRDDADESAEGSAARTADPERRA
jgi:sec-independent protein translocase protein TatB